MPDPACTLGKDDKVACPAHKYIHGSFPPCPRCGKPWLSPFAVAAADDMCLACAAAMVPSSDPEA